MSNIKLFESKQIRSVWNEQEEKWYFVVEDVISVLTDSADPKQYVKRMRQRDPELAKGWVQIVPTLSVKTAGDARKQLELKSGKKVVTSINYLPERKNKEIEL